MRRIIDACDKAGVQPLHDLPVAVPRSSNAAEGGGRRRPVRPLTLGDAYVKWWRTQQYYDSGGWRGTWALDGGGALMNQAIHNVDLLPGSWAPVAEVQANTATLAHERIEVEDTAVATLRFANGALGIIEATTAAFPGYLKRIELHGSTGSAVLEEDQALGLRPKDA